MGIKTKKPRSAGIRFQTFLTNDDITVKKPERGLVATLKRSGGRNAYGRITMRHKGGGSMQKYRVIDFRRSERNIFGTIKTVEYDPNRNVRIALVAYESGAKRYMLLPDGLKVGSRVYAGINADAKIGNAMPISSIPVGFVIHNVENRPGKGGVFARSAGTSIQLVARDEENATLRMPSGEMRFVPVACWATIGVLGNADYKNITWGKAGRTRHRGIRPTVRGMAMNPVDHPHGGGEGRSKSGSHPMTPWGKGCKGTRTRRRKSTMIIRRRR